MDNQTFIIVVMAMCAAVVIFAIFNERSLKAVVVLIGLLLSFVLLRSFDVEKALATLKKLTEGDVYIFFAAFVFVATVLAALITQSSVLTVAVALLSCNALSPYLRSMGTGWVVVVSYILVVLLGLFALAGKMTWRTTKVVTRDGDRAGENLVSFRSAEEQPDSALPGVVGTFSRRSSRQLNREESPRLASDW